MHTIQLSTAALTYLRTILDVAEGYDSVLDALAEAFGPDAETDDEIEAAIDAQNTACDELHTAIDNL